MHPEQRPPGQPPRDQRGPEPGWEGHRPWQQRPGGPSPDPPLGPPPSQRTKMFGIISSVVIVIAGAIAFFLVGDEPPPTVAAPAAQGQQASAGPSSNRAQLGERPTPQTTGVPPGVELRPSGSITVTEDGATVEGLDVKGCIRVNASNVTIRNVRITATCNTIILIGEDVENTLIEDVEINGNGNPESIAVAYANYTLRRAYIHNVSDGPRLGSNTTVESSVVHKLVRNEQSHNDGMQSTGGSNIVVRGNYIVNPFGQTSAILIGADQGDISDVLIEGNWLNGGGYTIYVGASEGFSATGIRVINNRFGRDAAFRTKTIEDGAELKWSGNVYSDGEKLPLNGGETS